MISGRHLSVLLTLKESYKRKEISLFKEVEGYRKKIKNMFKGSIFESW